MSRIPWPTIFGSIGVAVVLQLAGGVMNMPIGKTIALFVALGTIQIAAMYQADRRRKP